MIIVDASILFYAEDLESEKHAEAKAWLDQRFSGDEPVGLAWISCLAFIRVFTNPRAVRRPLSMPEVTRTVDRWLAQPVVSIITPSPRFWIRFQKLLIESQAVANLSSDAYLAALAIENDSILCSTDADFSRFSGLRWRNPLDG